MKRKMGNSEIWELLKHLEDDNEAAPPVPSKELQAIFDYNQEENVKLSIFQDIILTDKQVFTKIFSTDSLQKQISILQKEAKKHGLSISSATIENYLKCGMTSELPETKLRKVSGGKRHIRLSKQNTNAPEVEHTHAIGKQDMMSESEIEIIIKKKKKNSLKSLDNNWTSDIFDKDCSAYSTFSFTENDNDTSIDEFSHNNTLEINLQSNNINITDVDSGCLICYGNKPTSIFLKNIEKKQLLISNSTGKISIKLK